MNAETDMLKALDDASLESLYQEILNVEQNKVLPDDSRMRSLIESYYSNDCSVFMTAYVGFSRNVLFEIVRRHYTAEKRRAKCASCIYEPSCGAIPDDGDICSKHL